jgi:UDP-N-acetylglucosamine 2-epimerase (non-hydrolysing)
MEEIASAVRELAASHPDVHFLYPLHLNPRAREAPARELTGLGNVSLTDPLGYREMVWVLQNAHLVITDSGGLQEEAAGAGTPVLVVRDTTERPEGIEAGIARLVEARHRPIVEAAGRLLDDSAEYQRMASVPCPYGDGRAALRITDVLAGRPTSLRAVDHIYERPLPEHPLDALLREATAGLPRRYADEVVERAKRTARANPVRSYV